MVAMKEKRVSEIVPISQDKQLTISYINRRGVGSQLSV